MKSHTKRPYSSMELANLLGISERRVQQGEKSGIFCNIGKGRSKRFDVGRSMRSWIKYQEQLIREKRERKSNGFLARYYAERARKLKLANDKREESLVETEAAVATVIAIVDIYVSELERLPARMSDDPELLPLTKREVAKVIEGLRERCVTAVANLRGGRDPLAFAIGEFPGGH